MTDSELLARAEELQAEARDFLVTHHVQERLRAAGSVLLVGSYVTGLMVWRDLDVCVDTAGLQWAQAEDVMNTTATWFSQELAPRVHHGH